MIKSDKAMNSEFDRSCALARLLPGLVRHDACSGAMRYPVGMRSAQLLLT